MKVYRVIAVLLVSLAVVATAFSWSATTHVSSAATDTVVKLSPVADSYLDSVSPNQNYGSVTTLKAGSPTANLASRASFRFDLSGIPTNAIIDSAEFQTFLHSASSSPAFLDVSVLKVNAAWGESSVTWSNQPPATSIGKTNGVGIVEQYYAWDIQSLVQAWAANPGSNFGLELRSANEGTGVGWRVFRSREYGVNLPQLVIQYHLASATVIPTLTLTPTLTPISTGTTPATSLPIPTFTPSPIETLTLTPTPINIPTPTSQPASVGGRVWRDDDRDGQQDINESGVSNVRLDLRRNNNSLATTTTDANGNYSFSNLTGDLLYAIDVDETTLPLGEERTTCCDPLYVQPRPGNDVRGADFGYAFPPASNMDLVIGGIEVSQVTQCFGDPIDVDGCEGGDNSIPLIARKTTVARVYVYLNKSGPDDATSERVENLQVSLLAWDSGTGEILAGSPLEKSIPFVIWGVPLSNLRGYAERTANFLLPEEWTDASHRHGIDLYAVVESRNEECATCRANNSYTLRQAVFRNQGVLDIYPVLIHYTYRDNDSLPDEHWIGRSLFNKAKQFFPVNEEDVIVHTDAERILRVNYNLGSDGGMSDLLDDLADRFVCYQNDFWACGWGEGHYYGVIAEDVVFGPSSDTRPNGWGGVGRRNDCVAVGREFAQTTVPHELGHNLGRKHASNDHGEEQGGGWELWPYPHGGIGVYGYDTWSTEPNDAARRPGDPDGQHRHDLMSYGGRRWMSPHTYLALYENFDFCGSFPLGVLSHQATLQPDHFWLVSGRLEPTVTVRPIFKVMADANSVPNSPSGRYQLELQDVSGVVLAKRVFDPLDQHTVHNDLGAFRQYLPDEPGAARIILKEGNTVLFARSISAHAPMVTVTQPTTGTIWPVTGSGTIRWSASDIDGDALTYVVMYSRDGGQTWVNLATGLTEPKYDIELETLGGSTGQAKIRILANDGMRTSQSDSDLFSVAPKSPQVFIHYPGPDQVVATNQTILLMGSGTDREDGRLPDTALTWADSVSGTISNGVEVRLSNLTSGSHTITLTASDHDGNVTSSSVTIFVGHRLWLPLISK